MLVVIGGILFWRVPGSFVPEEDQGYAIGIVQMPPGSTMQRTREVMRRVGEKIRQSPSVDSVFEVAGFSFSGSDESQGIFFIRLKEIEDREETATEFIGWAFGNISGTERDGFVFFVNLPVINGLSDFGGFDLWLEDRGNQGTDALHRRAEHAGAKGLAEPGRAGRALQRPRAVAAPRAQARSRAGAVDGACDRRCLQRDPDHARARVRERLLLTRVVCCACRCRPTRRSA